MNLRIKAAYYEALIKNDIYPPWTIAFQPPPNLMTNQRQAETIVALRKDQAKEMLNTLSRMSSYEADECKNQADASTQALRTYYQQAGASQFNLNEALDALVTLTDRSQRTVHSEQQKKFTELSNRPTLALYMGFSDQLIPCDVKKSKASTFYATPQGAEPIKAHPRGSKEPEKTTFSYPKGDPIRVPGYPPTNRRGNLNALKMKKILQLLNL